MNFTRKSILAAEPSPTRDRMPEPMAIPGSCFSRSGLFRPELPSNKRRYELCSLHCKIAAGVNSIEKEVKRSDGRLSSDRV